MPKFNHQMLAACCTNKRQFHVRRGKTLPHWRCESRWQLMPQSAAIGTGLGCSDTDLSTPVQTSRIGGSAAAKVASQADTSNPGFDRQPTSAVHQVPREVLGAILCKTEESCRRTGREHRTVRPHGATAVACAEDGRSSNTGSTTSDAHQTGTPQGASRAGGVAERPGGYQ